MAVPVYNQTPTVGNRPYGYKDAQGNIIPQSFADMAFVGVYSGTLLQYKCFARPGASVDDPVWQLALLTYDDSNNLLSITWPQNQYGVASNDFQFVQSNYASYTYS